jgi:putative heme-binding domain-containing protein
MFSYGISMRKFSVQLLGFLLAMHAGLANAQVDPPEGSPITTMSATQLQAGQKTFAIHCARCHGMLGDGGEGPSLKRPVLKYATDDEALFTLINEGLPGTGMPGVFGPSDAELWQVAGYVRSLGRLPAEPMPGDPVRGAQLYATKGGCAACHISNGLGVGVGPELTDVGLRRNAEYLRRALTNPDADYPMRQTRLGGNINGFLTVRIVSEQGEFEGMRVNEDEFSIQLRDLSGGIRAFDKRELLNYQRAFGHSLMPGYETVFDNDEVNDLVSYLMGLKGASS